jgi:glycerol kinase
MNLYRITPYPGYFRGDHMTKHIGAIDQGTTSTRFILFDDLGSIVSVAQKEHEQIYPQPGWVEHNPEEIWQRTMEVIGQALQQAGISGTELTGIGITNQRETTIVWNRKTGKAVYNAIVWQDTRTSEYVSEFSRDGGQDRFREQTGLPLATYFSGLKICWILDHVPGARELAGSGDLLFGNIDSFLIWNLTGGAQSGIHVTDVTNASRTQLMRSKFRGLCFHASDQAVKSTAAPNSAAYAMCLLRVIWAISRQLL